MIVNIAPVSCHFDETLHVLKFSAMARQITVAPLPAPKKVDLPSHQSMILELEERADGKFVFIYVRMHACMHAVIFKSI